MRGASSTARLIATSIVLQDERGVAGCWLPRATIDLSRTMLAEGGFGARAMLRLLGMPGVRRCLAMLERRLLRGIQAHYVLRKHRIADWAARAIAAGATQVVILGAGMDGLGADLTLRNPDLAVIEIDHPATQAIKRLMLEKSLPSCKVLLQPIDLSGPDALGQLEAIGLGQCQPTLIIAEGLLMYLDPRVCLRLIKFFTRYFGGSLDLIFSAMETNDHGRPGFAGASPLIDQWLRWRGEPFRWAADPDRMIGLMKRYGIAVLAIERGDEIPEPDFPAWSACPGETLYRATRTT